MLLRLIPLPVHGAIELAAGILIPVLAMALGLDTGWVVAAVVIGATMVGAALSATVGDNPRPITIQDQHFAPAGLAALDLGLGLALMGLGLLAAANGQAAAVVFFIAAGTAQLTLSAATRYGVETA